MLFLTALRQARPLWGGLLLGVLLALLPLRGWAEATMHLQPPALQVAGDEATMPPCHAAVLDSDSATSDDAGGGCSLCSLCHSCALCRAERASASDSARAAAPAAAPQGHGPPALPLPERPPRA